MTIVVMSFQLVELAQLVKKDMEEVTFDKMVDHSVGAGHDLVPPPDVISSDKIGTFERGKERENRKRVYVCVMVSSFPPSIPHFAICTRQIIKEEGERGDKYLQR